MRRADWRVGGRTESRARRRTASAAAWLAVALVGITANFAAAQNAPEEKNGETNLVFEREVFFYEQAGRRDPFTPLTGDAGVFPRFTNITLRGVIHSETPGESVAIVADRSGRVFRVRPGEVLGDARVLSIARDRVSFAVTSFGLVRQEELVLPAPGEVSAATVSTSPAEGEPASADDEFAFPEDDNMDAADAAGVEP